MPGLTTPPVRIGYPNLFTPKSVNGGTPRYGITLMFDKKNKDHMDFLKKLSSLCEETIVTKFPDIKRRPRIVLVGSSHLSPIKDGDTATNKDNIPYSETNPELVGHYFIRAYNRSPVVLIDEARQEIVDQRKIYGGCWCQVNIEPYCYDKDSNKGLTFSLNGVKFAKDDTSFGASRPTVSEMFGEDGNAPNPFEGSDVPF
jgi:hypothetical protein